MSAADLQVMSFNIRYGTADDGDHAWPHRRDSVFEIIRSGHPDLLGTQECLAFQRDELLAALPAYAVVGAGRDDGAEAGEMCASFYRRDRFALLDQGTFWLSDTPAETASRGWDAALPRIATWLRLADSRSGQEILWLNTHFDHVGVEARRRSAELLQRWLAATARAALVVVTGDFNTPADPGDGTPYRALLGPPDRPLLRDPFVVSHGDLEAPTFHGFSGRTDGRGRIDWVLASPSLAVHAAEVDRRAPGGTWPSDHFPVTARLGLPPATPLQRAVAYNLVVPGPFSLATLDSLLAAEQDRPVASRLAGWAERLEKVAVGGYRFGLAAGGYVEEGRLAPGLDHDCISFIYRVSELARAQDARQALVLALETRFAGADPAVVVDAAGRVDYDHPAHLDYSVDMIRSGHWGQDVTADLFGARTDSIGTERYPAGSVTTVPASALRSEELAAGDLVWFVLAPADPAALALRREHGLLVGHAGVVTRGDGEVWLVHAASKPLPGWYERTGIVRVPLAEYLDRVGRYDAVLVTRF